VYQGAAHRDGIEPFGQGGPIFNALKGDGQMLWFISLFMVSLGIRAAAG
jgi:hypothetical protein